MIRTRGGRLVKLPVKYEPEEDVNFTDDFSNEEYDSGDESDVSSTVEYSDDDGDLSDGSFICDESESDKSESDEKKKKRKNGTPVMKKPKQ